MQEDIEAAREKLLAEVEEYCARKGCSAVVVFDAGGARGPGYAARTLGRFLEVDLHRGTGSRPTPTSRSSSYRTGERAAAAMLLVTGDYDQQKVAAGAGLLRMSSREFLEGCGSHEGRIAGQGPRRAGRAAEGEDQPRRLSEEESQRSAVRKRSDQHSYTEFEQARHF